MKKLILLLLLCTACQKEPLNIQVGMMYHIKSEVFNKGTYQPVQPIRVERIYTDPLSGQIFVEATDQTNTEWFIPKADLVK